MCDLEIDAQTGQATIWFQQGGQIARSAALNGNTAHYDINGVMVKYVVASPRGSSGCDLNTLGRTTFEHDQVREMLRHFDGMRSSR